MKMIVCAIPCVILSELAFLLGYLLTYTFYSFIHLVFVALSRSSLPRMIHASVAGLLCGTTAGFCSLSLAHVFSRFAEVEGSSLLVISMVLPLAGLLYYFGNVFKAATTGYKDTFPPYARFHGAMMAIPQRMQFTYVKYLMEQSHPEQVGLQGDPLGFAAYREAQKYLLRMTTFSFVGVIIGLLLSWRAIS